MQNETCFLNCQNMYEHQRIKKCNWISAKGNKQQIMYTVPKNVSPAMRWAKTQRILRKSKHFYSRTTLASQHHPIQMTINNNDKSEISSRSRSTVVPYCFLIKFSLFDRPQCSTVKSEKNRIFNLRTENIIKKKLSFRIQIDNTICDVIQILFFLFLSLIHSKFCNWIYYLDMSARIS